MHASRSGSTHTYAKRGVALDPPIIAGIVVVVVAFNLILAVSWCIIRDRKKVNKLHKRRISAPVDCEKYEHSLAFAITTGAAPTAVPLKAKKDPRAEQGGKSYYELIRALQAQPTPQVPSSPTRLSRGSSSSSFEEKPGLKKFILRPQDMKDLNGMPIYTRAPGSGRRQSARQSRILGIPGRVDLRRANSVAETASVYSSASAPIDYHDQLFLTQPFALDPSAPNSAPAWISQMPKPPAPAVLTEESIVEIDVPLSPTGSISEQSDASTVVQQRYSPLSPIAVSPISVPVSSTPSPVRTRTYSNPSAPPQVRWLTNSDASESSKSSKSSLRSKRPSSISSLSTILSLRDATSRVPAVIIAPLNVRRRSSDSPWHSVDLTHSTPLSPSASHQPSAPPALAPPATTPSIPARSPRRPPPSASVEHLPLSR